MDKDQIIAQLVRDVIKSWGPDDLWSFAQEQLTIFYMDNPDELIEDSAVYDIDDKLEERPPHWWNASQ